MDETSAFDTDADRLRDIARACPWFLEALHAASTLGLHAWCIGAGAVRNLVWDHLHGYATPSALSDVDLAYFDPHPQHPDQDARLQAQLQSLAPQLPWEVTNQALVHTWFEAYFGHAVPPLPSLEAAVATWPEYATAVGLFTTPNGRIEVIAPFGLRDLFDMRVQRNPARVSRETYLARVAQKQYTQRWPRVSIVPC